MGLAARGRPNWVLLMMVFQPVKTRAVEGVGGVEAGIEVETGVEAEGAGEGGIEGELAGAVDGVAAGVAEEAGAGAV